MYDEYYKFAEDYIVSTGDRLVLGWENAVVVGSEDKGNNVSTNFDKEIEKEFSEIIAKNYPDHGFQGEEFPELTREGEFKWMIDPIDGTKWFAKQIPMFSNVITLLHNQEAVVALVYNPISKQLYRAIKGEGAFMNDNQLKVNSGKKLENSQISFDFAVSDKIVIDYEAAHRESSQDNHPLVNSESFREFKDSRYQSLGTLYNRAYRVRDIGAGPFSFAWIAAGFFDGIIAPCQHVTKMVDHLGPALIASEAGAKVEFHRLTPKLNYFIGASSDEIFTEIKEIFNY